MAGRRGSQPRRRWRGKRERLRGEAAASALCGRVVDLVLIRRSAAPRRGMRSPPEQELLGAMTSHGPEGATSHPENQAGGRRKRLSRRRRCIPRSRRCLLKGCEQSFQPRRPQQRYCSERCRKAARAWSRWKAQARYRTTAAGKQKRNGQSRRYRERVKSRKPTVPDTARVITKKFFRGLL